MSYTILLYLLFLLVASTIPALSAPVSEKTVNVAMSASWPATPLLVETAEHVASIDPLHYWSFLTALATQLTASPSPPSTEAQWYEASVAAASGLLGNASMEILRAALALHTHSVKAQLYHILLHDTALVYNASIEQCADTVVQYNGRLGCDVASVADLHVASMEHVYEFDHIYPSLSTAANRTLILYADLSRLHQSDAHSQLVQMARNGLIQYVLRPKFVHASSAPLQLQGWGVELAIKNMEYKVLDDSRLHATGEADDATTGGGVGGATLWSRLRIEDGGVVEGLAEFDAEYASNAEDEKILVKDNTDYVLGDIALQASQVILHSADPLQALYELTGHFPAYASALTKVAVNATVRRGTERKGIQPGSNLISLHGQALSVDDLDVYALLALLQSHSTLIDYFASLHLSPTSTRQLLSVSSATPSDEQEAMLTMYGGGVDRNQFLVRMDVSDPAVSDVVSWMNDITRDRRYVQWPTSVREFLQPAWGQQLKYVRQNIYTGVVVADISTLSGLELVHNLWQFVKGNAPIRVGLVLAVGGLESEQQGQEALEGSESEEGEYSKLVGAAASATIDGKSAESRASVQSLLARLVFYLRGSGNEEDVWTFLDALHQEGTAELTDDIVWDVFGQLVDDADDKARRQEIVSDPAASHFISASTDYLTSRGFTASMLPTFVVHNHPYPYQPEHGADFRSYLMEIIYNEQRKAGLRVYVNVFRDRMDFAEYWNTRSNVYTKLAPHILKPADQQSFAASLLPTRPPSDAAPKLAYLTSLDPEREFSVKGVTYWVVADWDSVEGLRLAKAALDHVEKSVTQYQSRVAFIFNPNAPATIASSFASRLASAIVHSYSVSKSLPLLRKLASIASYVLVRDPSKMEAALSHFVSSTPQLSKLASVLKSDPAAMNKGGGLNPAVPAEYVSEVLKVRGGELAVVANGYVVLPPANATTASLLSDFGVLDAFVHSAHLANNIRPLVESFSFPGLDSDDLTSDWYSDIVLQACYALNKRAQQAGAQHARMSHVQWPSVLDASEDEAVVQWSAGPNAWMELKVLLNPLSKEAQQLAGVLLALRRSFNLSIQLFLNPPREVTQLPLKRFYHYAVDTQLHFDDKGAVLPFAGAFFRHLQTRAVLTLTVDTPEPWLVGLRVAPYDLDNLRLDVLPSSVQLLSIEYALEHLLINGQCFDHSSRPPQPPSGLQLLLSSPSVPYAGDTVVMQNLGYFQLKANPGVWTLSFAGRHASIYELHPTLNERQDPGQLGTALLSVVSLTDPYKRIFVQRIKGQEEAQLLEVTRDKHTGLFSSLFHRQHHDADDSAAAAGSSATSTELSTSSEDGDTIHIFSLASGHLYERFLKIMMLSVIQHTTAKVKFWFIRNFASPQFVSFVPQMAAHYGFSVEFITYKWPVWLRRQTEKQRVIWGYKILFLDVLWPLRIPRVIYIDADQVVRGDVRELWDMDLKGNPYAYTPFCDSNDDTKGFRFWDSGYWRDHLRGKPYHISALYVVDLAIFRAMRAGDSLRSIYDNLSADPNSLSNLDQDLPNYAQHMVPILSLPMEWLWCQTWCSMDSLQHAKTIDLCNNPLTKTPKLDVAKQLLPEWVGIDKEARELEERLLAGQAKAGNGTMHGDAVGGAGSKAGQDSWIEDYTHVAKVKGSGSDNRHDEL